ncbi:anti-sigma factor domain-containing protein [Serratia proteamaculans]|uniref:anti-sigma factor domain-containing protein n=1 Tax=Serratia proteamaculans TaxID=28151 RepID=UPI003D80AAF0
MGDPAGGKPVSLGIVAAQRVTRLVLDPVQLSRGMTIAISLEPAGGSLTGQPTGPCSPHCNGNGVKPACDVRLRASPGRL